MASETELQEAIANCDREPIHIPGTIQPFGALIAADPKFKKIEFASITTETLLGIKASDLLGQKTSSLFNREVIHQARNALAHETISEQRESLGNEEFNGKRFQLSIHLKDERSILEFLPFSEPDVGVPDALERTRTLLADASSLNDFQSVLEMAVTNLRISTGFDRVKAYRFLPDGSGEVVAESRVSHTDSFLGLRFPSSDIPPIARTLYASTPIRIISDINGSDSPIIAHDSAARPLDLSLAVLRGTADVHMQFLRNMGVKSSMTLPIVVDGSLWGLFSMHHMKVRVPDPTMLIASELAGKMLSLIMQHTTQTRHQGHLNSCSAIASDLFNADDSNLSEGNYWKYHRERLIAAIPCDGIGFIVDDKVTMDGDTPSKDVCLSICDLAKSSSDFLVSYDDLPIRLPQYDFDDTAGALVMSLSSSSNVNLILFRNLAVQNVNWAGMPNKEPIQGKRGLELTPRNSFSQYSETIQGKSDEWTNDELEIATVLRSSLSRELNQENDRKDTRIRLRLMIQELNHRVRNILTLVQSLSISSKISATSVEGYAVALEKRIVALAGAHDLLTREEMLGVQLKKIATLELRPYLDSDSERASLTGPDVILKPDVSPILALVLHELTSNAVKYGALSQPSGRVSVTWELSASGLNIEWLESGGPEVVKPEREGFGRSIIEDAIPYEFNGKAQIEFKPSGVKARFMLPNKEFESIVEDIEGSDKSDDPGITTVTTGRDIKRGLVVEDNFVIAKESKRWFKELGFQEVIAVSTVQNALSILDEGSFDFCLLDVNLRGDMSEPIAKRLTKLKIPYVFASGYGSEGSELCDQFDVPFLTKPTSLQELRDVLEELGVGK